MFYEYVERPCVNLAFIDEDNAVSVFAGTWNGAGMCAHKDLPIATTTCCPSEDDSSAAISCRYNGEKVSTATNEARCGSANVCPAGTNSISDTSSCTQNTGYDQWNPNNNFFQWTKGSCSMKVKVRLDGQIAIIHKPESISRVVKYVSQGLGNINFFVVSWPRDDYVKDELFPTIDNECGEGTCQLQDDDTCLCDVEVTNGQVFFDDDLTSAYTLSEFRSKVRIGSLPPSQLEGYPNVPSATITLDGVDIDIYHKDSGGYTEDTIFRLEDDTDEFVDFGSDYVASSSPLVGYVYLKNFKSEIQIGDTANDYYTRKLLF